MLNRSALVGTGYRMPNSIEALQRGRTVNYIVVISWTS